MIKRSLRFHGRNSLNSVYRYGKTIRCDSISLRYLKRRSSKQPSRYAVVVSRKVNKSAVVRNRIRRRIYEAVRINKDCLASHDSYDIVFSIFNDQWATMEAKQLQIKIKQLLDKALGC